MAYIGDGETGPEIFCCYNWIPYPEPGRDTTCTHCGSVFTVSAEHGMPCACGNLAGDCDGHALPVPNFYPADGPRYERPAIVQRTLWSPDFDAWVRGDISLSQLRCALCECEPCECPDFGTPEYFALCDKRHGITR